MKRLHTAPLLRSTVSHLHDGLGAVSGGTALDRAALGGGAWRFVDYWRLAPGTSIGEHRHAEGRELYFIISGQGTMTTNEETFAVQADDLVLNEPGDRHSLTNTSEGELYCLVTAVGEP